MTYNQIQDLKEAIRIVTGCAADIYHEAIMDRYYFRLIPFLKEDDQWESERMGLSGTHELQARWVDEAYERNR